MILYRVCAMGIMKEWQAMSCSACHAMLRRSELCRYACKYIQDLISNGHLEQQGDVHKGLP